MSPHRDGDESDYKDAIFVSPHKLIGGPGTPGVLLVRRELLRNKVPARAAMGLANPELAYHSIARTERRLRRSLSLPANAPAAQRLDFLDPGEQGSIRRHDLPSSERVRIGGTSIVAPLGPDVTLCRFFEQIPQQSGDLGGRRKPAQAAPWVRNQPSMRRIMP